MKIIFDSEEQKEIFLNEVRQCEICPSDIGLDENCKMGCDNCWEKAIECEIQ